MVVATYTIPNYPHLDQLTEPVTGGTDRNRPNQCVVTATADGLTSLTGRHYDGEEVQAGCATYGPNYVGPMDPNNFVAYCAEQGVDLVRVAGSQDTLLNTILAEVPQRHPVLVTIPSNWDGPAPVNPAFPTFSTHVVSAYGVAPSGVTASNPWDGKDLARSLDWWRARICRGQVWVMRLRNEAPGGWPVLDPNNPSVKGYFDTSNPEVWVLRADRSINLYGGLLTAYRNYASAGPLAGLTEFGLPKACEQVATDAHGKPLESSWFQDFERGRLVYDPFRRFDNPPGVTTPWYRGHVDVAPPAPPTGGPSATQAALLQAAHGAAPALTALLSATEADKADKADK